MSATWSNASSNQVRSRDIDNARFYAILDSGYVPKEHWIAKAKACIAGGADLLQIRAKKESPTERRLLAEAVAPLCQKSGIPLIINDDLDLCLKIPGAGLHVGQDDLPVSEARKALGPDRILGLSTHSKAQANEALEMAHLLTYFAVGPIFATGTKPEYTPLGVELIEFVEKLNAPLPWFCIGGITLERMETLQEAGARRIVVVSAVLVPENTEELIQKFKSTLNS